jgi:hypothetical protein
MKGARRVAIILGHDMDEANGLKVGDGFSPFFLGIKTMFAELSQ